MTIPVVVTIGQAKNHLRITETADDPDLELKLLHAHALVLEYLNQRRSDEAAWTAEIEAWTEATVPPWVQAGILYQVAELWRFRGDDPADWKANGLSPMVRAYVDRFRDPALA